MLALLLLELLAESCFFFELLNLALPESVSFNFSNNLLIGLSMMKPCRVFYLLGQSQIYSSSFKLEINVLKYSVGRCTAEQRCSSKSIVFTFKSLQKKRKNRNWP